MKTLAMLTLLAVFQVGCSGKSESEEIQKSEQKAGDATMERPSPEITLKLRQQFVDAVSAEELEIARKALIADLKKRYAGIDCHTPPNKIGPHNILFRQLMQEWNPIGFTFRDLKAIAGKPKKETDDSLVYSFDSGMKARTWIFSGRSHINEVRHHLGQ